MSHVNRFVLYVCARLQSIISTLMTNVVGCGKLFLLTLNYQQNFMLGARTFYGYDSACTLEIRYVSSESDVLAVYCKNT